MNLLRDSDYQTRFFNYFLNDLSIKANGYYSLDFLPMIVFSYGSKNGGMTIILTDMPRDNVLLGHGDFTPCDCVLCRLFRDSYSGEAIVFEDNLSRFLNAVNVSRGIDGTIKKVDDVDDISSKLFSGNPKGLLKPSDYFSTKTPDEWCKEDLDFIEKFNPIIKVYHVNEFDDLVTLVNQLGIPDLEFSRLYFSDNNYFLALLDCRFSYLHFFSEVYTVFSEYFLLTPVDIGYLNKNSKVIIKNNVFQTVFNQLNK